MPAHALPSLLKRCALYILTVGAYLWFAPDRGTPLYLFHHQDFPTLLLVAGMMLGIGVALRHDRFTLRAVAAGRFMPAMIVVAMFLLCAAGTWLVFGNYAFSRDELMADFDAGILHTGHLMLQVAPAWTSYSDALVPLFRHEVPGNVAWASNYLPGNAFLRTLADLTIGKAFASPMLAVAAALTLFRIARRLWPQQPAAPMLALVLLATSPQVLVTAMTPYAMTAHLALNLLWLWCYLRDDRRGVVAALLVGFLATGLHQLVFHPLFVLPFIVELAMARRWARVMAYGAGYAAIGVFWASYWPIAFALSGIASETGSTASSGVAGVMHVATVLVGQFDLSNILLVLINLLRLVAWQHILIVPLAALAWPLVRRGEGIARPLAVGTLLTLAAIFVLMPDQGNGWGYRYLHGLLGSLCLLAVYGWQNIAKTMDVACLRAAMAAATLFTVLVMLPLDIVFAHRLVRPYRTAYMMIRQSGTPIVLVDPAKSLTGQDLVRNAPDLSNRPLIMDIHNLDTAQLHSVCARYPVALFRRREAALAGIPEGAPDDVQAADDALAALGCKLTRPASWPASVPVKTADDR
jgi:hypothetical protein